MAWRRARTARKPAGAGDLRRLPKVELHRHLDGSVRVETMAAIARRRGTGRASESAPSIEELRRQVTITEPLADLPAVLDCFKRLQETLRFPEDVSQIAFENVEDCFRDGIVLAELRFAPAFIEAGRGVPHREIVEAVADGVSRATEKYPVQIGIIGILARGMPIARNEEALRAILGFRASASAGANLIVGLDLADREDDTDPLPLVPLVDAAREAGLGITVHSGENTSADLMRRALALYRPNRIGHGIKAWGDKDLLDRLRDEDILLELCPTSNWLTRSVPSLQEHPLPRLFQAGVPVSVNSDDPNLFAIDLTHEYELCQRLWGFGEKEFRAMNLAALRHSFLPDGIREETRRKHFA